MAPDRIFNSITDSWRLLETSNSYHELIPEFFYFADFLKNLYNLLSWINFTRNKF